MQAHSDFVVTSCQMVTKARCPSTSAAAALMAPACGSTRPFSAHGLAMWQPNVLQTLNLPSSLDKSREYVITVLIDHVGQNEEAPATDAVKFPFGILNYSLDGQAQAGVSWKLTGNLGGEDYRDLVRGPRNEGAMFAERQGYHLPAPPSTNWTISSPVTDGLSQAGVGSYSTSFALDVPHGYDVPMSFVFNNGTYGTNSTGGLAYRVQLFVNGYQFGKYVNNLGPQTTYPVPEGILNYHGVNYVAVTL